MRKTIILSFILISIFPFVYSCKKEIDINTETSVSSPLQDIKDWEGNYSIVIDGETLSDGSTSGRIWKFTIKKAGVTLETESYHEPIFCDGNYNYKFDKDKLNLFYNGTSENCKSLTPNFTIKKVKDKFLISSPDFGSNFKGKWLALKKVSLK